jgi:hypothetical protein
MIDFQKVIGYSDPNYPALDKTTPWFEFNLYFECCKSLDVKPSVQRFLAYNRYLKNVGVL